MTNMKPYDPEHKGEFCTRDGQKAYIWATDMVGLYPIQGYIFTKDNEGKLPGWWTEAGEFYYGVEEHSYDLMCVIPRHEARVITLDEYGDYTGLTSDAEKTFREVMPDDISQEKARKVIEAAAKLVQVPSGADWFGKLSADITALRASLGDEA